MFLAECEKNQGVKKGTIFEFPRKGQFRSGFATISFAISLFLPSGMFFAHILWVVVFILSLAGAPQFLDHQK